MTALESDVGDVQGGTTQEGIHMGVIAGTLDLIQRGYVGTDFRDGTLYFGPKLNDRLDGLSYPCDAARRWSRPRSRRASWRLPQTDGSNRSIKIGVGDEVREIKNEERYAFTLWAASRTGASRWP
jgi:trehalose/maltose hydrolase-like predicted phosphorylase